MPEQKYNSKIELKQGLSREDWIRLLQQLTEALQDNQECTLTLSGMPCVLPENLLEKTIRREVEYEIKNGIHTLELSMNWH